MRESDSRVSEARTSFLPTADASYLFTPAQQAAALRIPAGIFGEDEQLFRANFTRQNVLRFDVTQPIYTGGRLQQAWPPRSRRRPRRSTSSSVRGRR